MEELLEPFADLITEKLAIYGDFVFGCILGAILGWLYHRYFGVPIMRKSFEDRLEAKDETISAYRKLLGERISKIEVPKTHRVIWNKLKKFFNKSSLS